MISETAEKGDAESLRQRITDTVTYLRLRSVSDGEGSTDEPWHDASELIDNGGQLLALVNEASSARGIARADIGLSLFVQAYAFRVASAALVGWILTGGRHHLDISPSNISIQLGRNRPNAIRFNHVRFAEAKVHSSIFEHHLHPLVETAHRSFNEARTAPGEGTNLRIGKKLLLGNIGASIASSFGAVASTMSDPDGVRGLAKEFTAGAPAEIQATGRFVLFQGEKSEPVWAWERTSCCLWYQIEPADPSQDPFKCADCSLWTDAERHTRYVAATGAIH